jgi:hypothetical protein
MEREFEYDSRYHREGTPTAHGYHSSRSAAIRRDSRTSHETSVTSQESKRSIKRQNPGQDETPHGFWGNGFAILLVILIIMVAWIAEMLFHHTYGDTTFTTMLYCALDGAAGLIVCLLSLRLTFSRVLGRRHGFGIHILGLAFLLAGIIMVTVAYLVYVYSTGVA